MILSSHSDSQNRNVQDYKRNMCYARKRKIWTHIVIWVKKLFAHRLERKNELFEQDHWNVKIKKKMLLTEKATKWEQWWKRKVRLTFSWGNPCNELGEETKLKVFSLRSNGLNGFVFGKQRVWQIDLTLRSKYSTLWMIFFSFVGKFACEKNMFLLDLQKSNQHIGMEIKTWY